MRLAKIAPFVLAACLAASSPAAADERALGATVESLLDYARANPEYAAMRYEADAAAQRVYPAGAFADPFFKVELQNITNAGSDASPSLNPSKVGSTKYTVWQPIQFWGKRDLKRDAATADADQAQGRAAMTWADLAARIKILYARYYVAVGNEALTREILDLLNRLESVAEVRYASGLAHRGQLLAAMRGACTSRPASPVAHGVGSYGRDPWRAQPPTPRATADAGPPHRAHHTPARPMSWPQEPTPWATVDAGPPHHVHHTPAWPMSRP